MCTSIGSFLAFPFKTLNFYDPNINSPLQLLQIFLSVSHGNLVLDQDNNFYLISFSILVSYFLDDVWIFQREVKC